MFQSNTSKAYIAMHVAIILYGGSALIPKIINVNVLMIVWGRLIFAALVCLLLISKLPGAKLTNQQVKLAFLNGLISVAHWYCFYASVRMGGVSIASLSLSTMAIFSLFMDSAANRYQPRTSQLLLSLMVILGIYIALPSFGREVSYVFGALLGIAAGFLFSILTQVNSYVSKQRTNPMRFFFVQIIWAAVLMTPFAPFFYEPTTVSTWMWLALVGVVFTIGSHGLFFYSLQHVNAFVAVVCSLLEIVYSIFLAWLLLNEQVLWNTILGAIIIISSILGLHFIKYKQIETATADA